MSPQENCLRGVHTHSLQPVQDCLGRGTSYDWTEGRCLDRFEANHRRSQSCGQVKPGRKRCADGAIAGTITGNTRQVRTHRLEFLTSESRAWGKDGTVRTH